MNSILEQCPWCGSQITKERFNEIEARIRKEEQKKLEEVKIELTKNFELEKQNIEQRSLAEANKKVGAVSQELTISQAKIKQLEDGNAEFVQQARKEAETKATEERDKQLLDLRVILETDLKKQLLKQQEGFHQERDDYQKKITSLSNQLQKKSTEEIEGTSIDLFSDLQLEFPGDEISYMQTGASDEKFVQKIIYKGVVCGMILIDSKCRQSWKTTFVNNLRSEQVELIADHAILATTVFPKGKKDLCIEDGVIVAHPGCITHLVDLLRKSIVKMHIQGLSLVDRSMKVNRLYEFIVSEAYTQKRTETVLLTNEILEIDVQETEQHKKIWKKRGYLLTRLKNSLNDIDTNIVEILEDNPRIKTQTSPTAVTSGHANLRKTL